jgi:hypothetical protein
MVAPIIHEDGLEGGGESEDERVRVTTQGARAGRSEGGQARRGRHIPRLLAALDRPKSGECEPPLEVPSTNSPKSA